MKRSEAKRKKKPLMKGAASRKQALGLDKLLDALQHDAHVTVRQALEQPDIEAAIFEIAALSGQLCDDVSDAVAAKVFARGDPRACKAGCCWCCHQMVTSSPPLVFFLARAVVSSGALSESLIDDTRRAAERVRGLGARARLDLHLPCPLLGEDGTCAVYPVRPLACRGWNTYDAQACRQSVESPATAPEARVHVPQLRIAHTVESAVVLALRERGLEAEPVELIGALALALQDVDALARWTDGQDVFAEVRPQPEQEKAARWFARSGC